MRQRKKKKVKSAGIKWAAIAYLQQSLGHVFSEGLSLVLLLLNDSEENFTTYRLNVHQWNCSSSARCSTTLLQQPERDCPPRSPDLTPFDFHLRDTLNRTLCKCLSTVLPTMHQSLCAFWTSVTSKAHVTMGIIGYNVISEWNVRMTENTVCWRYLTLVGKLGKVQYMVMATRNWNYTHDDIAGDTLGNACCHPAPSL
jgi:hypothetical protein